MVRPYLQRIKKKLFNDRILKKIHLHMFINIICYLILLNNIISQLKFIIYLKTELV